MKNVGVADRASYVMVGPAVLVLVAVALYPLAGAVGLGLRRFIVVFGENSFIGLDNYRFLLSDARFWTALGNTAWFTVIAVSLELVLGMLMALLMDAIVPWRGALRAAVLVPWAIPTVVSARMWAWMFNPDHGVVSRLLALEGVNWLGTPGWVMGAAIVVDVWKTTPFVALLLLAGLQSLPREVLAAARVDGANAWQRFFHITLPLMWPTVLVALLFRTLDAFRVFDAIYVLTEGGPANTTETLSIYAYKTLMRAGDFGYGSTLSVATFICVGFISAVYLWLMRRTG